MDMGTDVLSSIVSNVISTYFKPMVATAGYAPAAGKGMQINGQIVCLNPCFKCHIGTLYLAFLRRYGIFLGINPIGRHTWIAP